MIRNTTGQQREDRGTRRFVAQSITSRSCFCTDTAEKKLKSREYRANQPVSMIAVKKFRESFLVAEANSRFLKDQSENESTSSPSPPGKTSFPLTVSPFRFPPSRPPSVSRRFGYRGRRGTCLLFGIQPKS